ncbi:hypothetical protein L6164_027397 [Bauhinia variegata]|uniref:Uncharacterized protein n=1 Tax=Bauhinia variegata TaxID=167791 RepID=A0ACB9LUG7_BAUVA|nr:hypothetical protein L6164_027397 [Bauhinia variegata]
MKGKSSDMANPARLAIAPTEEIRFPNVPYVPFRAMWMASHPSSRPDLIRLFYGTNFVFNSPKPREKCEELKARLKKLEDLAERNAYKELVNGGC